MYVYRLGEESVIKYKDSDLSRTQLYSTFISTWPAKIEEVCTLPEVYTFSTQLQRDGSIETVRSREPTSIPEIPLTATSLTPLQEFSELAPLVEKLINGRPLDKIDRLNLDEIVKTVGWSVEDVVDELKNLGEDPLNRVSKYRSMFEKYYKDALELVKEDRQQAAEKLWGAITALIKLHASSKGVFIAVWDHSKFYNYITNNVERKYRDLFHNLLMVGEVLHKYFYEGDLDEETFKTFWTKALELLDEVKRLIYAKAV
ncbi:MAG: PaREP1 family protein [Sulfolobales archaeon]